MEPFNNTSDRPVEHINQLEDYMCKSNNSLTRKLKKLSRKIKDNKIFCILVVICTSILFTIYLKRRGESEISKDPTFFDTPIIYSNETLIENPIISNRYSVNKDTVNSIKSQTEEVTKGKIIESGSTVVENIKEKLNKFPLKKAEGDSCSNRENIVKELEEEIENIKNNESENNDFFDENEGENLLPGNIQSPEVLDLLEGEILREDERLMN
ncbi:hypothetical protein HERIO_1474 [Hepatospora eriocheir]|uniref:Uncharacterized protein n=1 Tax=Hepatospora eriocheir TaxID=1081669 RepID=A0A1X0Q9X7_9MICR|nr:hypothetical protein HERIO_1474 [Hepatospora eriocheir]